MLGLGLKRKFAGAAQAQSGTAPGTPANGSVPSGAPASPRRPHVPKPDAPAHSPAPQSHAPRDPLAAAAPPHVPSGTIDLRPCADASAASDGTLAALQAENRALRAAAAAQRAQRAAAAAKATAAPGDTVLVAGLERRLAALQAQVLQRCLAGPVHAGAEPGTYHFALEAHTEAVRAERAQVAAYEAERADACGLSIDDAAGLCQRCRRSSEPDAAQVRSLNIAACNPLYAWLLIHVSKTRGTLLARIRSYIV